MMKLSHEAAYRVAMAAGQDAANRSAKAAGRQAWSDEDYAVACRTVDEFLEKVQCREEVDHGNHK